MAQVSDLTLTNREEMREACTVLLVITGDNDRDVQTLVVLCRWVGFLK